MNQWALRELPYRTDEDWQTHLQYAVQDSIDKVIDEAKRYREWKGYPSIAALRAIGSRLKAIARMPYDDDPDDLIQAIADLNEQYAQLFNRL